MMVYVDDLVLMGPKPQSLFDATMKKVLLKKTGELTEGATVMYYLGKKFILQKSSVETTKRDDEVLCGQQLHCATSWSSFSRTKWHGTRNWYSEPSERANAVLIHRAYPELTWPPKVKKTQNTLEVTFRPVGLKRHLGTTARVPLAETARKMVRRIQAIKMS